MIAKTVKGSGFSGAQKYIEKNEAEILSTNNLFTVNHAQEMRIAAEVSNVTKPVLHSTLSLPDGEHGTREQWIKAGEAWLTKMGFDLSKTQYSITRHNDSKHDHVHILANRVMLDGKVNHLQNDYKQSHKAARAAEIAGSFQAFNPQAVLIQKGKIHELRSSIDHALKTSNGELNLFKATLKISQIVVIEHRQSTGRLSGLSFQKSGDKVHKGSEIGKQYSTSGLAKRGLDLSQPTKNHLPKVALSVRFHSGKRPQVHTSQPYTKPPKSSEHTLANLTWEAQRAGDLDLLIRKRREYQM